MNQSLLIRAYCLIGNTDAPLWLKNEEELYLGNWKYFDTVSSSSIGDQLYADKPNGNRQTLLVLDKKKKMFWTGLVTAVLKKYFEIILTYSVDKNIKYLVKLSWEETDDQEVISSNPGTGY